MDFSNINKAVAGGIVGLIVAEAARYGWQIDPVKASALGVLVTAAVGYVVGHVLVFVAPKNKVKPVVPTVT